MQTARDLIGVVIELAAGMQHRHDDLCRRNVFLRMHISRNATPIVTDGDGLIEVDHHANLAAVSRERFIDGVIHQLEDHVMQARAIIGIADVHAGALAYCIQALENLDAR